MVITMLSAMEMLKRKNTAEKSRKLASFIKERVTKEHIKYPFDGKIHIDNLGSLTPDSIAYLKGCHIEVDIDNCEVGFTKQYIDKHRIQVDVLFKTIDDAFEIYQEKFINGGIDEFKFKLDCGNRSDEFQGAIEHLHDHFEKEGYSVDFNNWILIVTIPSQPEEN